MADPTLTSSHRPPDQDASRSADAAAPQPPQPRPDGPDRFESGGAGSPAAEASRQRGAAPAAHVDKGEKDGKGEKDPKHTAAPTGAAPSTSAAATSIATPSPAPKGPTSAPGAPAAPGAAKTRPTTASTSHATPSSTNTLAPTASRAQARPATPKAATGDEVVDHFMDVNWDDKLFWQLVDTMGVPGQAPKELISEIDRWLPPGISPEARATIKIATVVGKSLIDGVAQQFMHMLPVVGGMFTVWDGMRETADQQQQYKDLGDPVGELLTFARGMISTTCDLMENALAPVEGLADALKIFDALVKAAAVAATVGTGTAAAPVAGAAAEAEGAVTEPIEALIEMLDVPVQIARGIELAITLLLAGNAAVHANQATGNTDVTRAAKYNDLLSGLVIDAAFSAIELGVDVVDDFADGFDLGTINTFELKLLADPATTVIDNLTSAANDALQAVREEVGQHAIEDALQPFQIGGTAISGDAMRSKAPFVPEPVPTSSADLSAAQDSTAGEAHIAQAVAQASPPQWTPELVAMFAATPPFSFATTEDKLRPTYWIGQLASVLRQDGTLAGAAALDGIGSAIDTAAAWLQPGIDEVRDGLQLFISLHLPQLQKIASDVSAQLQAVEIDLGLARTVIGEVTAMLANGQNALASVGVLGSTLMIDIVGGLERRRITNVPNVPFAAQAAAKVNGLIDSAIANVVSIYTTKVIPLEIQIAQAVGSLRQQLAQLSVDLAEGGKIQKDLEDQYRALVAQVQKATDVFAKAQVLLPRLDISGAGDWLRRVAASYQNAVAIERGQAEDPWQPIIQSVGPTLVSTWKATRGPDVERAYNPEASAAERAAVDTLVARAHAIISRVDPAVAEILQRQLAECLTLIAQRGVSARVAGWKAEARLATTIAMYEGATPATPTSAGTP